MPSKHDPPSDSSSSSEEEEEVAASRDVEQEEEDEDEEDVDEEEEEDTTPVKPSKPNPTPTSVHPQPPSDDSDESESESDESDSPTPAAPLDIKPISSKPMMSSSSSKSQRPTVVALASAKRRLETDEKDLRKDKKKKKVADLVDEDHAEKQPAVDDPKKSLFQRLWTEDDEVVLLKGMVSFKKKGMDVTSHLSAFVDTIKDSLHISDITKTQVQSKIRTLKRKFQNAAKKAKPGEDPENLKPHDVKLYQLSKKIWPEEIGKDGKENQDEGKSVGDNVAKGDDKKSKGKSKSKKAPDVVASPPNLKATTLPNNNTTTTIEVAGKDDDKKYSSEYFYLNESRVAPDYPMMPAPPLGLGNIVLKRGWDVIGSSKAQKLDERWKKVIIAETKAYLQRLDLVKEQTQAMLDALESSNV